MQARRHREAITLITDKDLEKEGLPALHTRSKKNISNKSSRATEKTHPFGTTTHITSTAAHLCITQQNQIRTGINFRAATLLDLGVGNPTQMGRETQIPSQ